MIQPLFDTEAEELQREEFELCPQLGIGYVQKKLTGRPSEGVTHWGQEAEMDLNVWKSFYFTRLLRAQQNLLLFSLYKGRMDN